MTRPQRPEARFLRFGFLTLLFVSIGGMALGFVGLFFVESSRVSEWLSRGAGMMLVGFLTATGGLATTLALQKGKLPWLMRAVVLLLVATAVWWAVFIWIVSEQLPDSLLERLLRVGGTLATLSFAALLVSQLLLVEQVDQAAEHFGIAGRHLGIGVGEAAEDLRPFNAEEFVSALFDTQ